MTRTTATILRPGEVNTIRTMVVCDDRDVMRLGLVEMLQTTKWATELMGFSSLPTAWTYLAGSSATSAIAILGGTSAGEELAATGRPRLDAREFPMPAPMAEFLLRQVRGFPSPLSVRLSSRGQAVLRLIADGATNKTIADELGISVHGIKHHVASLLKQLNCANRTEAASTAMRRGLVSAEPVRSADVRQALSARD